MGQRLKDDKSGYWLKHGALIVGYGVEDDVKYLLIQGSWGKKWGIEGFAKIPRDAFYIFGRPYF